MDDNGHLIGDFFKKYEESLNQPIIEEFLSTKENYDSLVAAILNPIEANKNNLDQKFKLHYSNAKKIKYISNFIKYFSIDFDKRIRKLNQRFLLTLDKPIQKENSRTMIDLIANKEATEHSYYEGGNSFNDQITNELLLKALDNLTTKQRLILELLYVNELSNIEIAIMLDSTPQNISNIHKKTLKKLKKLLLEQK